MFKQSNLSISVRSAIAIAAIAASGTSAQVFAEDAAQNNIEKIQVTGSRIAREGATAPSPVTSISGEDLISSGVVNIGEALNDLPALAATFSLANSGRYIGTAGLNILDLRNMGTDRTLVLVNGKRHVSSSAGSASVDTNTIPTQWVERVEIITGGASAVYGADAVTGVVNFILKEDIEGFDITGTKGVADNHGYNNEKLAASFGTNFADDRGNIAVAVEYAAQDSLNQLDNPWYQTPYTSLRNQNQPEGEENNPLYPDRIYTPNAGYYAINNAGVFSLGPAWWSGLTNTFNPDGSLREIYTGDNVDGLKCADCDSYDLGQFNESQPEFSRWNLNTKASYYLNDDTKLYAEAKYSRSEGQSIGQPAFFFFDPENSIKRDNAFLNPEIGELMDENGVEEIVVMRMMNDLGRRIEDNTRETARIVAGVSGLVADEWDYDISVVHGKTDLERVNGNNMIMANYFNALDAVFDDEGNIVCRDEDARAAGCVPVNIMGEGAPSQEAIDYINTVSIGTSEITQSVLTATIANPDFYELPAGYIGVAGGVEYREEQSESHEPENAEGTFFNMLGEDNGEFDVKEAFVELSVPVLADLPYVENLTLDTAVRFADYSTIGAATSWKVGADWAVNDELRFRVTQSEAIRAPNISEIFGAASQTYYRVDDPCKASELDMLEESETRRANCAALGIDPGFDSGYDSATIEGLVSGNENVNEEKSTSTTIGAVYQPYYVEDLTLTVDYWSIELEDAIATISAQDILDRCVDSKSGINNQYCDLITRDPASGEITLIQNSVLNVAGQEASGIDFEIGYNFDAFNGRFVTNLIGTYLIDRKEYPFQENQAEFYEFAGTAGDAQWQANLSVDYSNDNFYAGFDTRYIEEVSLYTDQELEINPNPNSLMSYGTYFVTDINVGYVFDSGVDVKLGIDNLFNRRTPLGAYGDDSGSAVYDNIGRFAHLTVSYSL